MGWLLTLTMTLSLLVRGYGVSSAPIELFGDEVDIGYQAYSLLKTGKDLYGQVLPTYIHSLAEWRAPLLMYATVPTIATLGNTELGVRLPQVLFGAVAPLLLFLLTLHTTRSKKISLLAAFILSITPWHIYYSRAAFEVVLLLDLIMLGTILFLRRRYVLSLISFALAMYTYSTAIVFVPALITVLFLKSAKKPNLSYFLLFIGLLIPLIYHTVAGPARDRFGLLSVFSSDETTRNINDFRSSDNSSSSVIWHNKIESYPRLLFGNYLRAFSSEFLFVRGDPTYRHSIQVIGQLLPVFAPFLLLGLYWLLKSRHYFWLLWLGLSPLPSIVTNDGGYHATRLFVMLPPLVVAISGGVSYLVSIFHHQGLKKLTTILIPILFMVNFTWVAHYYLKHYTPDSWRWWHAGFKTALQEVGKIQADYTRVFINNTYEPSLIRYLFYTSYPPEKFHKQFTLDQPQKDIVPGYEGFSLDGKVFFGSFSDPIKRYLPGSLYVISQRDDVGGNWDWRTSPPGEVQVLFASTNPFNLPVLYLVTKK